MYLCVFLYCYHLISASARRTETGGELIPRHRFWVHVWVQKLQRNFSSLLIKSQGEDFVITTENFIKKKLGYMYWITWRHFSSYNVTLGSSSIQNLARTEDVNRVRDPSGPSLRTPQHPRKACGPGRSGFWVWTHCKQCSGCWVFLHTQTCLRPSLWLPDGPLNTHNLVLFSGILSGSREAFKGPEKVSEVFEGWRAARSLNGWTDDAD